MIGIRPGEKLHEMLITAEDGRHTVEYDGLYVILPQLALWQTQNYKNATELADGFNYASDNNGKWLKINELKKMVKEYSEPFGF